MVAVVAAAASLAACGSGPVGTRSAATVDGHRIGGDQVIKLLDAQTRFLRSQAKDPANDPAQVNEAMAKFLGGGRDTYASASAADALGSWITYQAIRADLARHGEKVTDADRSEARSQLVQRLGDEAALKKVDKDLVAFSVNSAAAYTALGRVVAKKPAADREQQLKELYAATKETTPLCLRIIFSQNEQEAAAAQARLDAGDDFAMVARELSADPTTAAQDGFAGCASVEQAASAFGEGFEAAAVGDVVGPIAQAEGASVLVQVAAITGPTFEQVRAKLEQQLDQAQGGDQVTAYVSKLLLKADVQLDPRYGTWDAKTGLVTPPATDAPTPTAAPAAVAGP